jgi:hypothetical protein
VDHRGPQVRTRARTAIAELTDLSESVVDLHGCTLAVALGTVPADSTGPLTSAEGEQITRQLRKGR